MPMFVDLQSMLSVSWQGIGGAGRVVEGLQELEAKGRPASNGATTIDSSPPERAMPVNAAMLSSPCPRSGHVCRGVSAYLCKGQADLLRSSSQARLLLAPVNPEKSDRDRTGKFAHCPCSAGWWWMFRHRRGRAAR